MWIEKRKRVKYYLIKDHLGRVRETCYNWYSRWEILDEYSRWEIHYQWRGRKGYQKKPHHKKKPQEEKDLLEAKRLFKDQHKDRKKARYKRSCPKWIKRVCNKKNRQWERELIHHERFDEFHTKNRKDFLDPWMWN